MTNQAIAEEAGTWRRIKRWYLDHGYTAAAADLKSLMSEWSGKASNLLAILNNEDRPKKRTNKHKH
jgi:hypothetical protein